MTVLGGYLGAGKTTLLNDLLARGDDGERVAVVVNDFGDVTVDATLVRSRSRDTLELANGCVCCSLRDGMAAVMDRLRAMTPPPARVLVEVSGVGDPAAVAGWGDHPGFERRGVVVCADVLSVRTLARDRWVADTVVAQLRGADVVLLTKRDLATAEQAAAVRDWITSLVPSATVLDERAELARLPHRGVPRAPGPPGRPAPEPTDHAAVHATWSIDLPRAPRADVVRRVLGALPTEVVRAKGVLRLADRPGRRTVVQLAAGRVTVYDDGRWDDHPDAGSLVVITRGDGDATPVVDRLRRDLGTADDDR